MRRELYDKLDVLGNSFLTIINTSNPHVTSSLKKLGKNEEDIRRIEFFDWFQGVGLYGFYKLYEGTKNIRYLTILEDYYRQRMEDGLPEKNVNAMAPMLTLLFLSEELNNATYKATCLEWAKWLYEEMPRTIEGGFQHITCEADNENELWDDTLFMSVLFLAKAGLVFNEEKYIEEAIYQFLIHTKYLVDPKTGLWYHGWTFNGNHNFVKALWGRGNSWITIFIPEFLEYLEDYDLPPSTRRYLEEVLKRQVKALKTYQSDNGLWHTLVNDTNSYVESSATCGFAYGILKAVRSGCISDEYKELGFKALEGILPLIDEMGILHQVSGGTAMGKDSLDFYRNIPLEPKPYGQAMAMLLLTEALNHTIE